MYNYICLPWRSVNSCHLHIRTCISIHKYASTFTCLYLSYPRFIIITCVLFRPLLKQKSWHLMELTIDTNETVDMTNAILDSSLARWQLMLCDSPPNIKCVKPNHSFDSLSLFSLWDKIYLPAHKVYKGDIHYITYYHNNDHTTATTC